MTDETPHLKALHTEYVRLTGLDVPCTMQHLFAWREWSDIGWTVADLKLVVRHLQRKYKDRSRVLGCLKFRYLIGDREGFAEDLAEARALARRPKRDAGKESVLRVTGRASDSEPVKVTVRTPADVMAGDAAFKRFLELRDGL